MSNRSIPLATLAGAALLLACVAARPASAQDTTRTPKTEQKAAPGKCTTCQIEVENRYDYQVFVFDRRETSREDVSNVRPLGKALARSTVMVQTQGRPNQGITVHEDVGSLPTPKGLKNCRQEPTRPESGADFRYACGY